MARRRRFGRAGHRRRSYWEAADIRFTAGLNIAANVPHNSTLYSLSENDENQSSTIVRLLGSVYMGIQSTPAFVACVFWMVYWRPFSSAGGMVLDAFGTNDVGSEHVMHWRVKNEFQGDLVHHSDDDDVDIKVMRKLNAQEEIASAFNCTVAYHITMNLRGLFLAS